MITVREDLFHSLLVDSTIGVRAHAPATLILPPSLSLSCQYFIKFVSPQTHSWEMITFDLSRSFCGSFLRRSLQPSFWRRIMGRVKDNLFMSINN
jgi:hypothetical protein